MNDFVSPLGKCPLLDLRRASAMLQTQKTLTVTYDGRRAAFSPLCAKLPRNIAEETRVKVHMTE